jgi:uncharacterized protein
MDSALYVGTLRHRRFEPKRHEFSYDLFMAFLDIDRLPELMRVSLFAGYNRFNWASFHEHDHFGDPQLPLRERLHADAAANGISLPDGPIFLLTHLRYLGYVFNPVSFFYCYNAAGNLETILAEVNNTFGENHNYWLDGRTQHAKRMHVSPFMPMDMEYRFTMPAPGGRLVAQMNTRDMQRRGRSGFDATLRLERRPWNAASLHSALLRFPWMTAKVIGAIHWEALQLYFKKLKVFTHIPKSNSADS